MGSWSSLFGSKLPEGLRLDSEFAWEVSPPDDYSGFFARLAALMPPGSILYLEGTSMCREVRDFLSKVEVEPGVKIAVGTLWPKPGVSHIPATSENLQMISEFLQRYAQPEVCDHLHLYLDGKVLLEWHDAFHRFPFLISKTIQEQEVRTFCETLGLNYREIAIRS